MKLLFKQESRNTARPLYIITNDSNQVVYFAKSRFLNYLVKIDVMDEKQNKLAHIRQSKLSIVPKLKISVGRGNSFVLFRKLSIHLEYRISGRPFEISGSSGGGYTITKNGKQTAYINTQGELMNEYILEVSESEEVLDYACIVLAIDLTSNILSRARNSN